MKRSLKQQVFVLMLGILVVLGLSLSTIPTGAMAMTVGMAGSMPDASKKDCGDCTGSGDAKMLACSSFCVPPVLAVLAQLAPVAALPNVALLPGASAQPTSWTGAPDPSPPRTFIL
jgi:hypothetical protein